jgi:hypothetical protein
MDQFFYILVCTNFHEFSVKKKRGREKHVEENIVPSLALRSLTGRSRALFYCASFRHSLLLFAPQIFQIIRLGGFSSE